MSTLPSRQFRNVTERRPLVAVPKGGFRFIQPSLPSWRSVQSIYRDAYRTALITNGALVERFERATAERLKVKHCIAVSSCTSGLMLVLKALALQGEVILPSFTFFATGEALLWTGLRPVFADCQRGSWTIDPCDVARKITKRTSAILAVHLYGNPCDVDALTSIATAHGLKLIFDAAHAFGSEYAGMPVGSFGDAEVFSLSPTKLLVAGEGGLVATNDALLARKIRAGRNYGDLGAYNPELLGLNARMSEFNAALAIAGLDGLDRKIRRHQEIARLYGKRLAGVPGIRLQEVRRNDTCTFKDYSIHVSPGPLWRTRDSLAAALLTRGIQTKLYFYPPLHKQTLFNKFYDPNDDSLRVSEETSNGILSLPIYQALPNSAVKMVADAIGG